MAREHPAYRDNYEDLLQFFDGKRLLTQTDVIRYTGKDRRWVVAHIGLKGGGNTISVPTLARKLCEVI